MSLPVFYTPLMVADSQGYSPSAVKPALVMQSWLQLGYPIQVLEPAPVTRDQLYLAHDRQFIDAVLDGVQANGFGNRSREVAVSLPFTSGSMLAAARCALSNRKGAISPSSGFHHAGYDFAGGFCTFNGLMVTTMVLLNEDSIKRVSILDLDMHWGNGTDDIIQRLGLNDAVNHYSSAPRRSQSEAWLQQLPELVTNLTKNTDLLIYQAGADSHVDDPLGGYLDTEQMQRRDELVFATAKKLGVPVAWNLAGGYQRTRDGGIRPVLDLHDNTLKAFARITMEMDAPMPCISN